MNIADSSSSSSLSDMESEGDSMMQLSSSSSWLESDDTDSRSLSSEKTLFSSSTLHEEVDGLDSAETSACAVTHRRVRASEVGRSAGAGGLADAGGGEDAWGARW